MSIRTAELLEALTRWRIAGDADRVAAARHLLDGAESALSRDRPLEAGDQRLWHDYLEETGRPRFLTALGQDDLRRRWAESAFAAIRRSNYRLVDMMSQRVEELASQALFEELSLLGSEAPANAEAGGLDPSSSAAWTYDRVLRRAQGCAAVFLDEHGSDARVALYLDNSIGGACCDLACLFHDILVSPLSPHFDLDDLAWIFDRMRITVAVSDTDERLRRLLQLRQRVQVPFTLFAVRPGRTVERGDATLLDEAVARLTPEHIDTILEARPHRALDEICTVMFTSGSTGRPKGVAFTASNLVTKRFARAAALPTVGQDERMLCYLPLYHTFGRYLEMLGTIFWRGSYVFAGNPSAETLLAGLRRVRPTGLISIPMRWAQIRERIVTALDEAESSGPSDAALRDRVDEVTGGRLRWGLSAAGYLDPRVFRFFQHHGVELCSGFGMTEATGGITMSPPGDYLDHTVGVALPGMRLRFTDKGEMLIGGVYVARYLTEEGQGLELAESLSIDGESWLETGDIFQPLERGHVTIVDRIKDIYKNSRGQTVAPRRVEREFEGVPGIRRTFLVGDRRTYNTLLIVPDPDDPVLAQAPNEESQLEYFHQIVAAANQRLAPYERVVTYARIDRDFSVEKGELTPKGSFRRKAIEENFAAVIDDLYGSQRVELEVAGLRVLMPHWFHRDLGVLEDDIVATSTGLFDRRRNLELPIWRRPEENAVGVGDLEYQIEEDSVDLGIMSRQPHLWLGNPALIRFAPCKDGWDVGLRPFRSLVLLPADRSGRLGGASEHKPVDPPGINDPHLLTINRLVQVALFSPDTDALQALRQLSDEMAECDDRQDATVRHRIKALARHPDEELRCLAYRVLLLDRPMHSYNEAFGSFIRSGLPFLNEESIHAIATTYLERRRLEALRQRLYRYRQELDWPADETARRQLQGILRLLVDFVHHHPRYFKPVRGELACWTQHSEDPELARYAEDRLHEMGRDFERRLEDEVQLADTRLQANQIVVDDDIPRARRQQLRKLLSGSAFLQESLFLTYDEHYFDPREVPPGGIWVSPGRAGGSFWYYRVSINTTRGRHFHLLVVLRRDMDVQAVRNVFYWMMVIAEHPFEPRVIPRFGCVRPELAALSLEYVDEPTAEEKIRQYASMASQRDLWRVSDRRKLYVRSMAALFRAWSYSGRRIVPGSMRPSNVVVPELDSHASTFILSLGGWKPYKTQLDLFRPLHDNFYRRTVAHHPICAGILSVDWIFDACLEGLGAAEGKTLLRELYTDLSAPRAHQVAASFAEPLAHYLERLDGTYHVPLAVQNAIDRYHRWHQINPGVTQSARTDEIDSLARIYRLERHGELARYHLYRHTYFASSNTETLDCFDRLLAGMIAHPDRPATQRVELSDLQATITDVGDRETFGRMVFPRIQSPSSSLVDVVTVGSRGREQVTLRSRITDRNDEHYGVREPLDAEEVGQVYRLFLREHFPMRVSELDRYLIVLDASDRVVAGVIYKDQEEGVVELEGLVVKTIITGRGIASALLDDFLDRMANRGVRVVKTGLHRFGERRGFKVNRRWGGLVRFLRDNEDEDD